MTPDTDLPDELNNYLNDTLPPESRTQLEARLLTDEALRDELDLQRSIREGVLHLYYKNLFRNLHHELQANGSFLSGPPIAGSPIASLTGQAKPGTTTPEQPENH